MNTIFLVGFMGCGKTHTGRQLAARLQQPFLDMDAWIEASEGQTIGALFERLGESGFRELERDYLQTRVPVDGAVVSTGGGAPCFFDNMDWMNRRGVTIYLDTDIETLAQRLDKGKAQRPLLKDLDAEGLRAFIAQKLLERAPFYRQARHIVEQTGNDGSALAEILRLMPAGD